MKRFLQRSSLVIALCVAAHASASDDVAGKLQQTLQQRFPAIRIEAVQPSPVAGLYQVIADNQVAYVDASGDHLIAGKMMDTRTRHDLSADALDAYYSIKFDQLPFDEAIKIVKGNGEHKIALFEDPDCPYCRQLEQSMQSLNDLTVYLFLFPIPQLHPNAMVDAKAIWCSPDRASAWTNWMLERTPPPAGGSCANDPITRIHALAASLHVHATPTIFLQNGKRIGQAVSGMQLARLIAETSLPASGQPPAPRTAAN